MKNHAKEIQFDKTSHTEHKVILLEQSFGYTNELLKRIDNRLEEGFNKVECKITIIEQRLWTNFYWLLGAMFTLACAAGSIMAKGFGWF